MKSIVLVIVAAACAAAQVSCKKQGGDAAATAGSASAGSAVASGSAVTVAVAAGSGSSDAGSSDAGSSADPDPWAAGSGAGSGSAGSGSGSGTEPTPPSTGNEIPAQQGVAMTPAQALEAVAEAVKLVAAGNPPCEKIVTSLEVALPIAFPVVTKDAVDGLMAYGKCAKQLKRWRSVVVAGTQLLDLAPEDKKTPAVIVRALAEMGEYDKALKVADVLAAKRPDARPNLVSARTFVYCKSEQWAECVKNAEAALAALAKEGIDPKDDNVLLNRMFRDLGWIVLGKPKQALDDFAEIEQLKGTLPPTLQAVRASAQLAIQRGFYLEIMPTTQLPLGVYHLMGRSGTGSLLTIKLDEHTGQARRFRVEVEVPGVTERSSNTLSIKPHEGVVRWANPPLKIDLDFAKIRSIRPAQLAIKITELGKDDDEILVEETVPIEVLPRDYLPLKRRIAADALAPTYGYLGAWITSNDKAVEDFLGKAKERVPQRQFVGVQDTTIPQVQALFDELKARGVSYVMDPDVTSDTAWVQRTRLPAEVLASTNAQCLEGTLLFATLLEAIGIQPIIVIVPGHAFVGWHTVPKDGTKGEPLFVETTMVGSYTFEQAVKVATARVAKEIADGTFKSGASTLIDVPEIRKQGFTAQPM